MSYSPNWSPGDPLQEDEKITDAEKAQLVKEGRMFDPTWSDEDEAVFYEDDPEGSPES